MKNHLKIRIIGVLLISLSLFPSFSNQQTKKTDRIKVACIGDSITFGARLTDRDTHSYPAQLQQLLGNAYEVQNFGVGSLTLIRKGIPTVWNELPKVQQYAPDIVIISLGTNDTCGMGTCGDRKCWEYKDEFKGDYSDLIDLLSGMRSEPQVWVCAPSPMVLETLGLSDERVNGLKQRKPRLQELISMIQSISKEKHVGFIDLNAPLDHKPELFTIEDGVHPNQAGYRAIAALVFEEIKN